MLFFLGLQRFKFFGVVMTRKSQFISPKCDLDIFHAFNVVFEPHVFNSNIFDFVLKIIDYHAHIVLTIKCYSPPFIVLNKVSLMAPPDNTTHQIVTFWACNSFVNHIQSFLAHIRQFCLLTHP